MIFTSFLFLFHFLVRPISTSRARGEKKSRTESKMSRGKEIFHDEWLGSEMAAQQPRAQLDTPAYRNG
jgi:hypothetical protein